MTFISRTRGATFETAGAARTRHSPLPLFEGEKE